eukprot:CAMPEP_0204569344 /NCGR_PEP_ID=MMETSP0661-20131031/37693_1 /ASSEMBLY_ACC=CAM_ASM_000606 /TAXON_ID=109239 /ORGANISM="Alexandrium margalefi, Strain AMGDE01CS-322" /LENGTH=134 /DNA_ID=CAMNT_0051577441 /DNA_START=105 /DNA_END=508 /DNA_ORIENTATION=-
MNSAWGHQTHGQGEIEEARQDWQTDGTRTGRAASEVAIRTHRADQGHTACLPAEPQSQDASPVRILRQARADRCEVQYTAGSLLGGGELRKGTLGFEGPRARGLRASRASSRTGKGPQAVPGPVDREVDYACAE